MSIELLLFILAGTIVLALSVYAVQLWRLVRAKEKQDSEVIRDLRIRREQAKITAQKNIGILLRVIDQEQVSLTEGAIRIMAFVPALTLDEQHLAEFKPFERLAQAAAHIPILEDWEMFSPKQKSEFNQQRAKLESIHRHEIIEATKLLLQRYDSTGGPPAGVTH